MPIRTTGAARWYAEKILGGPTRPNSGTLNVQNTATQIVSASPDRVNLTIVNQGAFNISITTSANGSPTTGILLGANGGNVTMNFTEDVELVSSSWWGISSGGAVNTFFQEAIADLVLSPEEK